MVLRLPPATHKEGQKFTSVILTQVSFSLQTDKKALSTIKHSSNIARSHCVKTDIIIIYLTVQINHHLVKKSSVVFFGLLENLRISIRFPASKGTIVLLERNISGRVMHAPPPPNPF